MSRKKTIPAFCKLSDSEAHKLFGFELGSNVGRQALSILRGARFGETLPATVDLGLSDKDAKAYNNARRRLAKSKRGFLTSVGYGRYVLATIQQCEAAEMLRCTDSKVGHARECGEFRGHSDGRRALVAKIDVEAKKVLLASEARAQAALPGGPAPDEDKPSVEVVEPPPADNTLESALQDRLSSLREKEAAIIKQIAGLDAALAEVREHIETYEKARKLLSQAAR